jgi:hypothetical protein
VKLLWLALLLAYVPSPGSLLKRAAQRVTMGGKSKEVSLSGTLTVGAEAKPSTLTLHFPLDCKLDDAEVKGTVEKPFGDAGATPAQHLVQQACPFIAYRGLPAADAENALRAAAAAEGADLTAGQSIGRFQDRVVYVIGPPQKPQVWVYKDGGAPARVLAGATDLRLLQYGNPAAADWFPRVLELWEDGKLTARFEVLETRGMKETGEEEEDDAAP